MDWDSLPPEQARDMAPVFQKLTLGDTLTKEQREQLKNLISEQPNVWALSMADLERANVAVHRIETGDAPPVATRMYRYSKLENDCINQNTSTLMENGLIRPSKSPYAAPPVPVMDGHKGDGAPKPRICFDYDYRALNAQTKSDMYPMPLVDEELAAVNGAQWFSTMDLMKGFYQIPMDPEDCCKTAFITEQGLFEFDVMPFGLKNAPATFQRAMQNVLVGCPDFLQDTCG